ncbi:Zn(2)-C6 fungal-type DNA-binding domain protein [Kalmanozyma brasiliensis GHG001]|uniref:Zn(2)-C6 fungal-type DNA-binding domain protein n=1 Tax=Kalmanozyma brasiliensis (strain GHG001) TaxID=1365824 RepID=UPI002867DA29|nr:Zn(2)-C6 fungal-type DNA-binding domain protein [Kalmanozyma brasiliensis GHG001]KAF6767171.1 Zn(2)-C6 fungal-type DNA-binding domain protein [Kalmanozyma brasiliensis GHG001]
MSSHTIPSSPSRPKPERMGSSPIKPDTDHPASTSKLPSSDADDKKSAKRPREQYSCVECFRRKQKCDRRFPCNNCIKRRLPERCVPPPSARVGGGSPTPSDGGTPHRNSISRTTSEVQLPTPAAKRQRLNEDEAQWDDRRIDELARTTSRIARLERILALNDASYLEQRLALAEKAVRLRLGEEGSRGNDFPPADHQISRRSSYIPDENETDRHADGHLDDNDGFLGTSALEAVPLQLKNGLPPSKSEVGADVAPQALLSYIHPNPTRRGFPIPSTDVQAIRATLPSREQCERYFDAYFAHYNWARLPLHETTLRDRFRQFVAGVPSPSDVRMDAETLPFVALVLAILTLGSVPPIVQPLSSAISHAFFWATKKALVLCETLGLASLDSCWAHGVLVRYLDVIRVTRASWHEIGSWIRDALDLGLHRDGSSFNLPKEQVAARRILWSHVIHNDREWSIILGRPLTITFFTTEMPTREDLEPLGFACQTYLLARNRFTACLEAITHCFEERSASRGPSGRTSRAYYRVLEVEDMIAEFVDSLPPYLASTWSASGKAKTDTSLDQDHPLLPFYRYLILGEVCFYRSLLHRPYLLRPATHGKHPFPESRRVCVETALNDLRLRKEYARILTKEQLAQSFGGAYALFNSAIVVGMSLLIGFSLGERIDSVDLNERIGYLQNFITQLRRNFDAGNVDASAEREQMVIEVLVSRLEPFLPRELAKRSKGELAAAKGSMRATMLQDPMRRGAASAARVEQEKQAADSLRLLSTSLPGTPTMSNNHAQVGSGSYAGSGAMQHLPPSHHLPAGSPSMGGVGGMGGQFDHGSGMFAPTPNMGAGAGTAAGGSTANPIDPYGWLLTPTAMESPDTKASSTGTSTAHTPIATGNGRSNSIAGANASGAAPGGMPSIPAAATPSRHHGHSLSGSNPAHFMAASPGQFAAGLAATTGNPVEGQAMFDWEGILQTIGSGWTGDGTLETGMESLFG